MKKIILLVLAVLSAMLMQAQIYSLAKGKLTNVNDFGNNYIEVTGVFNFVGSKLKYFYLDYGQDNIGLSPDKITDEKGVEIKLKSTGAMINYFDKNGWLLIDTYSFGNASQAAMRYIFKKKLIKTTQ